MNIDDVEYSNIHIHWITSSDWLIVVVTGDGLLYSIRSLSFILSNTISGTKTFIFLWLSLCYFMSFLYVCTSLCVCAYNLLPRAERSFDCDWSVSVYKIINVMKSLSSFSAWLRSSQLNWTDYVFTHQRGSWCVPPPYQARPPCGAHFKGHIARSTIDIEMFEL